MTLKSQLIFLFCTKWKQYNEIIISFLLLWFNSESDEGSSIHLCTERDSLNEKDNIIKEVVPQDFYLYFLSMSQPKLNHFFSIRSRYSNSHSKILTPLCARTQRSKFFRLGNSVNDKIKMCQENSTLRLKKIYLDPI